MTNLCRILEYSKAHLGDCGVAKHDNFDLKNTRICKCTTGTYTTGTCTCKTGGLKIQNHADEMRFCRFLFKICDSLELLGSTLLFAFCQRESTRVILSSIGRPRCCGLSGGQGLPFAPNTPI